MVDRRPLIGDQFRGLPMEDLIGGPLITARDAQDAMAKTTADFVARTTPTPPPGEASDQDPDA